MTVIRIKLHILLLLALVFLSACNDVGTARFDELARGLGISPVAIPQSSLFAGITSYTDKTDSTVTLNWSAHPNALQYILYNVSSGTPSYFQTITNPALDSLTLTGLTAGATYKFRLRLIHDQGEIDDNTNDVTIVMSLAPTTPSTPIYHTPVTSPGTKSKPTFTVNGVKAGDVIRLYKDDDTCKSLAVASGTVEAGETSIDLQLTSVLDLGNHVFYADAENSANQRSGCTEGLNYELIKANCPAEYIQVPENEDVGIDDDFCVAKYEMKNVSGKATSQAAGNPWGQISAIESWDACLALNSESNNSNKLADTNHDGTYTLISNPEWMTIARSIEAEGSNWVGGVLNRGWSAGDFGPHDHVAPQTDLNCLYSSGKDTCAATGEHKFKRTHNLKNTEVIWDFAGNVNEWTDWSASDSSFTLGPNCVDSDELYKVSCGLDDDSYMPLNPTYTSEQNIGVFKGDLTPGRSAAARGGYARFGSNSGVYNLYLEDRADDSSFWGTGFRCVFRP